MSLKHRACVQFLISSSLVVTLCTAVLLTTVGNDGLLFPARGEAAEIGLFEQATGDLAVVLLQSHEFAGFVTGRDSFASLVARCAETHVDATVPWLLDCAERGRSPALATQKLHFLYCVWIV